DQMLQSRFEIQVSNFVGKQEKQTAQRPRVVVVTAFPFHYEITGKHDRGVADEHIKRTTMKLRSQLQVRFGKFEERLNAPTHAVDANDFSLFQRQIGAEQNQPIPPPMAVLHKDQFDRQTAGGLNDDRAKDFFVFLLWQKGIQFMERQAFSVEPVSLFHRLDHPNDMQTFRHQFTQQRRLGKPTVHQDKVSAKSSLNRSIKQSRHGIR